MSDFLKTHAHTHAPDTGVLYDVNGDNQAVGILIHGDGRTLATMEAQNKARSGSEYPLTVPMPCGESRTYESREEFPTANTPCPCGKDGHWLVFWVTDPPEEKADGKVSDGVNDIPDEAVILGHRIEAKEPDLRGSTRGSRGRAV